MFGMIWFGKKKGNSLVYGIYVAEFSAYMLNYQHCCFYWKIYAEKSAYL